MTLKLNGTNSVAAPAYAGDDADTGLQCGTNELKLVTGGTARATITTGGNVGIGTVNPTAKLEVNGSATFAGNVDFGGVNLSSTTTAGQYLSEDGWLACQRPAGNTGNVLEIYAGTSLNTVLFANGRATFTTNSTDTSVTDVTQLVLKNSSNAANTMAGIRFEASSNSDSDYFIVHKKHSSGTGADLIVQRGSNERLRFIESGGIAFNGDTAQANALDDYEEGTWSPGVVIGTCTASDAKYIKIGNLVKVCATITGFSDRTTATILQINNVPFSSSQVAQAAGSMFGRYLDRTAFTSYVKTNGGVIEFYSIGSGNFAPLQHQHLNNGSSLIYLQASWIIN